MGSFFDYWDAVGSVHAEGDALWAPAYGPSSQFTIERDCKIRVPTCREPDSLAKKEKCHHDLEYTAVLEPRVACRFEGHCVRLTIDAVIPLWTGSGDMGKE